MEKILGVIPDGANGLGQLQPSSGHGKVHAFDPMGILLAMMQAEVPAEKASVKSGGDLLEVLNATSLESSPDKSKSTLLTKEDFQAPQAVAVECILGRTLAAMNVFPADSIALEAPNPPGNSNPQGGVDGVEQNPTGSDVAGKDSLLRFPISFGGVHPKTVFPATPTAASTAGTLRAAEAGRPAELPLKTASSASPVAPKKDISDSGWDVKEVWTPLSFLPVGILPSGNSQLPQPSVVSPETWSPSSAGNPDGKVASKEWPQPLAPGAGVIQSPIEPSARSAESVPAASPDVLGLKTLLGDSPPVAALEGVSLESDSGKSLPGNVRYSAVSGAGRQEAVSFAPKEGTGWVSPDGTVLPQKTKPSDAVAPAALSNSPSAGSVMKAAPGRSGQGGEPSTKILSPSAGARPVVYKDVEVGKASGSAGIGSRAESNSAGSTPVGGKEELPAAGLSEGTLRQISDSATHLPSSRQGELHLSMEDKSIGRVEVGMKLEGGELNIRLSVESHEIRDALNSRLPELKAVLQTQGAAGGVSISVGAQGQSQSQRQSQAMAQANAVPGRRTQGAPAAAIAHAPRSALDLWA